MMVTPVQPSEAADPRQWLEPQRVERLLCEQLPIDWPVSDGPREVRVERCWPVGREGFLFEWSFQVGDAPRLALFAWAGTKRVNSASAIAPPCESHPTVTQDGIRHLWVSLPREQLIIHSPDCDPRMAHLARCLDVDALSYQARADRQVSAELAGAGFSPARACLVGYRAGRRAAIHYQPIESGADAGEGMLGKTYRDDRARRLLDLHKRLDGELADQSGGRIRVPKAIGYVDSFKMALFHWAPGKGIHQGTVSLRSLGLCAIDVLSVLHRTPIEGLPAFSIADECAVLARWMEALRRLLPHRTSAAELVSEKLLAMADTVDETPQSTIHRDFYEAQFVTNDQTVTLLDLDTLAVAHPCVDLGNLLAHLYLRSLQQRDAKENGEDFDTCATELVARYEASSGRMDRRALRFYLASSLLRLGAVHAARTATGSYAEALWDYASATLSGVSRVGTERARV